MAIQKSFTAIFMLLFSLPFIGIGGKFGMDAYHVRTEGIQTEGKVIEMRSNGEGNYAPTISFATEAGETIIYEHNVYAKPADFSTGDKVDLFYLAESPKEDVYVVSIFSWLFPLIFGTVGIVIFCIGAYQLLRNIRGKPVVVRTIDSQGGPIINDDNDIETPESFIQRND